MVGLAVIEGMFGNVTDPTDSFSLTIGGPGNIGEATDEMLFPLLQLGGF